MVGQQFGFSEREMRAMADLEIDLTSAAKGETSMKPKQGQWHLLTGTLLGIAPGSSIFLVNLAGQYIDTEPNHFADQGPRALPRGGSQCIPGGSGYDPCTGTDCIAARCQSLISIDLAGAECAGK